MADVSPQVTLGGFLPRWAPHPHSALSPQAFCSSAGTKTSQLFALRNTSSCRVIRRRASLNQPETGSCAITPSNLQVSRRRMASSALLPHCLEKLGWVWKAKGALRGPGETQASELIQKTERLVSFFGWLVGWFCLVWFGSPSSLPIG